LKRGGRETHGPDEGFLVHVGVALDVGIVRELKGGGGVYVYQPLALHKLQGFGFG